MCYDETDQTDSDNDFLSSGPMFIEDTNDTDNKLPHIEGALVKGPGAVIPEVAAGAATAPGPDAHPVHSDSDKCKCAEDYKDKVLFFLCILFCF